MTNKDDFTFKKNGRRNNLTIKGKYAFFYGQWPSNWEYSPFTLDGIDYVCMEQYMMAQKAKLFNDNDTLNKIMKVKTPYEHKKLGREVKNYNDKIWSEVRYDIVKKGTIEKYKQNSELCKLLLNTNDLILVEASQFDKIWGIGMKSDDPNILDETKWGQNLLGKIITEVRDIIKNEHI